MPEFSTQAFVIVAAILLFLFSRICNKKFIDILTNHSNDISDDDLAKIIEFDTDKVQQPKPENPDNSSNNSVNISVVPESSNQAKPTMDEPNNSIISKENRTNNLKDQTIKKHPFEITKPTVPTEIKSDTSESTYQAEVTKENVPDKHEHPFEIVRPTVRADVAPEKLEKTVQPEATEVTRPENRKKGEHPFEIVRPTVSADVAPDHSEKTIQSEATEVTSTENYKKGEHPFEIVRPTVRANNITDVTIDDDGVKIYSKK